jgi:hypothetical protein
MVLLGTLKKSKLTLGHNTWISSSYRKHILHHAATSKFLTTLPMTLVTQTAQPMRERQYLLKKGLKHYLHVHYTVAYLQATSITVEDWVGPFTIAAVYCPPKHEIKADKFRHFYTRLGHRFLAGGDFNAKHTHWGSRLTNPRGRELFKATQADKLLQVSTGEPTYWPTDRRKIPDLLDFGIIKGIPEHCVEAEAGFDFSSDHSPVLVTMHTRLAQSSKPPTLTTNRTNWATFKQYIQDNLTLQFPLKTNRDIEDYVHNFTQTIQQAAWT